MQQVLEIAAELGAELGIRERELDERLEVRLEVADVVAALAGPQPDAVGLAAAADDGANGVGQLNLSALAPPGLGQRVEDRRRQHVAGGNREIARRFARRR